MPKRLVEHHQWTPRTGTSVLIFTVAMLAMGYLRLVLFSDRIIPLTYGLPLLFCLWYPSRKLLWSLAAGFLVMSAFKAFVVLPDKSDLLTWLMQVANIAIIAAVVHVVLQLLEHIRQRNAELEKLNREYADRGEEISRQNEELRAQGEELEHQAEELQQQTEELERQAAELQSSNASLEQRQAALEAMLHALDAGFTAGDAPQRICDAALRLFGDDAVAAAVVLREGDDMVVHGSAGHITHAKDRWKVAQSLAQIVLEKRRPAAIADLALRGDIIVPRPENGAFAATIAAPVILGGEVAGALEFYSESPHSWTREHFSIAEWAAAQCSLILEARRLHDRLQSTNVILEGQVKERTRQLEELVNELEHFSYTITHDLRAPLRAMQGYAGILADEYASALDETGKSYLHRISTAATRMDLLITDALSYSRAVRQEFQLVPVHPTQLVRSMLESYPNFQSPKATVEIVGELPPVLANEAGLTQCLSNLMGNAVKFVAPGVTPHVRIRGERIDGVVRLWVEDNGIGIAPEMHSRLFNMFQRLSKNYEGTGIGLALVRKVAERMGGRVGVDSKPGQGSRFWLELQPPDAP